jgi:hypothetical protein
VPAKANRCPHCWAALADYINDWCPHCHRNLAAKQKRWGGGATADVQAPAPPPAAPAPYEPYEFSQPAPLPAVPVAAAAATPVAAAPAAAPAGGGVAVAERDRLEFPGTPLPPGFFDSLPQKEHKPKNRRFSVKTLSVGGVVAVASMGGIGGIIESARRSDAISSPARHIVAGACAEYRSFTTRMNKDRGDTAASEEAILWFQSNVDRFAEAAIFDPKLAAASEVVTWFNGAIEQDFEPIQGMTEAELDAFEKPLIQACYKGPGRA